MSTAAIQGKRYISDDSNLELLNNFKKYLAEDGFLYCFSVAKLNIILGD